MVQKKNVFLSFLLMEVAFVVYSLSSVVAKIASGNPFPSFKFIMFYGLDVLVLGVYAILWQQVIKRFELSIAYANKAVCLIWALVWSVFIFNEADKIRPNQIIGIVIVILGIVVLNLKDRDKDTQKETKAKEAA